MAHKSRVSKLSELPVALPTAPLPHDVDPISIATSFADVFDRISDPSTFTPDAIWRDTFCFTGTLRTFYSATGITNAWPNACSTSAKVVPGSLQILLPAAKVMALPNGATWVEVSGSFKVKLVSGLIGSCTLMLGVVPSKDESKSWKVWTLRTVLDDVEGWPSVNTYSPQVPAPNTNGHANGHTNGAIANGTSPTGDTPYFDVIVIGGGQSGLSTAGRLQALGINYVVMDKYEAVGDSWASRYDSARLHTPREYSHLPFDRTFPGDNYQEFLTKDDLKRGYTDWCTKFGISTHIWTRTEVKTGTWNATKSRWTLQINRKTNAQEVQCRFIILCAGAGGQTPYQPQLPGSEAFRGEVLHSKTYRSARAWSGKRGIVVGTANTAHDIAQDMLNAHCASVTMIQRSPTYVLPVEHWSALSGRTYNADFPTELADKLQMTGPNAVGRLMLNAGLGAMAGAEVENERYEGLERRGFKTERYGDLMWHLLERAGGHYMDVGNCKNIVEGRIDVKSDALPVRYTETGLAFDDGAELPADVIVWATGFEVNVQNTIRQMFGEDVAEQAGQYFGVDDEGEVNGAFVPKHPGLICHGIALGQARFWSKYIALQVKADLEGKPFVPYKETPVPPKLVS